MAEKEKAERQPTERVVLQEIELVTIWEAASGADNLTGFIDALGIRNAETAVYVERGTGKGSKTKVVDDVVGKNPGTFRAPSLSSWRGAVAQDEEVVPESRQFRRRRVD